MSSVTAPAPTAALRALRRHRQRNRLVDLEWFEAAYRAYLVALFGGGAVLWISSAVGDGPVGADTQADVARYGPAALGLVAVVAVLIGLRGGAQGGPLALEEADVAHVMMAPVPRRAALARPAWQRVRSSAGLAVVIGAIGGQMAGRRLPGSPSAWAASGALFGLTVGLLWAGSALIAHAIRLPLAIATATGVGLTAWQAAAVARPRLPAPANTAGSLAMWGWRQRPADVAALAVAVASAAIGLAWLGRTRIEALARRASLVAQLRFAVTTQDLRTVILLRRQLNQESTRRRPWARPPNFVRWPVVRRGWHGIARFAVTRVVRMVALAAGVGVSQAAVAQGSTAMVIVSGFGLFLLGLEVTEPLAQEIDHPSRSEALPAERGRLFAAHLVMPAVALAPLAAVGGVAAWWALGRSHGAAVAVLAWPTLLASATGSVVSIVRDARDPATGGNEGFVPPEMVGMITATKALLPLLVSTLGAAPVLLVRSAATPVGGGPVTAAAVRAAIGAMLLTAVTALWVYKRDAWKKSMGAFMAEGRAVTAQQRAGR
jgi:hypothetical protein